MKSRTEVHEMKMPYKRKISPALLIIDTQNKYLGIVENSEKERSIFFINLLIDLFRLHDFPVFRIYHLNTTEGESPDTEEFEYPVSIMVRPEDKMIVKSYSDAFNKTDLDRLLKERGCNT
jgi:nicotinamidase-related amidase